MSSKKLKTETTFLGKYVSKKKLGKGAFGDVYLVEQQGKQHALKIIDKKKMTGDNQHLVEYLNGEIEVMKDMDTQYIVQLREFLEDDDYYYMLLEYCNGGDLLNMQASQPNRVFSLESATEYLSQVILGLEVLHKKGYLHRDIKPQNVLVKNEGNTKVVNNQRRYSKLQILGSVKRQRMQMELFLEHSNSCLHRFIEREWKNSNKIAMDFKQICGLLECSSSTCSINHILLVYSQIFVEINPYWTLDVKYTKLCEYAKDFSYKKAVVNTRKKVMENCTQQIEDLFRKMFRIDTAKRISFSQIRQHPVFSKHFPKPSQQSQILYKTKFKSSFLAKGKLKNNLTQKAKQLSKANISGNSDFKPISMLCVDENQETYEEEKKILKLEVQEIYFLYEMVGEIEAVEKNIGLMQTLMFAFNLIKYNIVLSNKFISNLTPQNYNKKYKGLKWAIFFSQDQFRQLKKQFTKSMVKSQTKYQDLYLKCKQNLKQIKLLNNSFPAAFNEEIVQEDFIGDFYRSYRKSTDIIYQTLKEYLKTNKDLKFYYFLCMNCICHVFSDLVDNEQLKLSLFKQIIQAREGPFKEAKISYQKLCHYLKSSGKDTLVRLAKRIIEQVMIQ